MTPVWERAVLRGALAVALVLSTGCTDATAAAPPASAPEDALRIEASFYPDRAPTGDAFEITVDGSQVEVRGDCRDDDGITLATTLDAAVTARLRDAVVASDFFGDWSAPRMVSHSLVWDVTLTLGDRTKTRSFRAQESWDGVARVLGRLSQEAAALHRADVHHELRGVEAFLRVHPPQARVLDRRLALPVLRRFTTRATTSGEAYAALRVMTKILDPSPWHTEVASVLAREEPGWRRNVLACFDGEDFPDHERTLVPAARAELAAALADQDANREELLDALRVRHVLLASADAESLPLWVAVTERCSVPDHALPAEGLVVLHERSVPAVARLLHHERAPVRQAAAMVVGRYAKLGDVELAVIRPQLDELVFPRLREMERNVAEEKWARNYANRALAEFGLSVTFRERDRRAREARAAERARTAAEREENRAAETPPPAPKGEHAIGGRLLLPDGTAATGFTVVAMRRDGTAEQPWRAYGHAAVDSAGRFAIGELVDGEFALHVDPRWWDGGRHDGLASFPAWREGVRAGATNVEFTLPFAHWIRGRLLDHEGRPVHRRHVGARLRGDRTVFAAGEGGPSGGDSTDKDGRFWIAGLVDGAYDLRVNPLEPFTVDGHEAGAGIDAGADQLVLRLRPPPDLSGQITGVVHDERGDPLRGASVGAHADGFTLSRTKTRGDGTFALRGLPPGQSVSLVASAPVSFRPSRPATATVESITVGATDVLVVVDPGPRTSFTIDGSVARVRVFWDSKRVKVSRPYVLFGVPDGVTLRVEAFVKRRGADGELEESWVRVGTLASGTEEHAFGRPVWPD